MSLAGTQALRDPHAELGSGDLASRRADLWACAALLGLTLLALQNVIRDPTRILQEDLAFQWEGMHAAANEQIRQGRFPHWDPHGLGGFRLYAEANLALFHPPTVVFRFLPFATACVLLYAVHYAATAILTYWFARRVIGVGPAGAMLTGMAFALGGFSLSHSNHLNFVLALPLLPLLLLAVHGFRHSSGRSAALWWTAGTGAIAAHVLSGGVPILFLSFLALCWFLGVLLVRDILERRARNAWRMLAGVVTMGVAAVGLSAVQLLPTLDMYTGSYRAEWGPHTAALGAIPWQTLLCELLAPGVLGGPTTGALRHFNHEATIFAGIVALLLAISAVTSIGRRPWVAALVVLIAVALPVAMGNTVLVTILDAIIPVHARLAARCNALAQFGLALLAGIGLERAFAAQGDRERRRIAWIGGVAFVLMTATTLFVLNGLWRTTESIETFSSYTQASTGSMRRWLDDFNLDKLANLSAGRTLSLKVATAVWCMGGLGCIAAALLARRRRRLALAGLMVFAAIEMQLFAPQTWVGRPPMAGIAAGPPEVVRYLIEHGGRSGERYFNSAHYGPLWDNRGGVYGLASVDGYIAGALPMSIAKHEMFKKMHGTSTELNLFATRYVLVRDQSDVGPLRLVHSAEGLRIYENPERLPLAMLLESVRSAPDHDPAIELLRSGAVNPAYEGVVTSATPIQESGGPRTPEESCRVVRWDAGDIELAVQTQSPRWIFVSTSFDHGWQASADGRPADIHPMNICFVGLRVERGEHRVQLFYRTPRLIEGAAISLATIVVLVVAFAWATRARRRRR